jgi:hypothetical protein
MDKRSGHTASSTSIVLSGNADEETSPAGFSSGDTRPVADCSALSRPRSVILRRYVQDKCARIDVTITADSTANPGD